MRRQGERGMKILGICFGAQLLAVALGGKAGLFSLLWQLLHSGGIDVYIEISNSHSAAEETHGLSTFHLPEEQPCTH